MAGFPVILAVASMGTLLASFQDIENVSKKSESEAHQKYEGKPTNPETKDWKSEKPLQKERKRERADKPEISDKETAKALRKRAQHLVDLGKYDEAKRLEGRMQKILAKIKQESPEEDFEEQLKELTKAMQEMQRSMKEMRAEINALRKQVNAPSQKERDRQYLHGFRGIVAGELLKKDLHGGSFAVQIDSIRKTWEENKAKHPEKAKGQVWQVRGVTGKWLDVLDSLEIGESLEVEAFHIKSDQLDFGGEWLKRAQDTKS